MAAAAPRHTPTTLHITWLVWPNRGETWYHVKRALPHVLAWYGHENHCATPHARFMWNHARKPLPHTATRFVMRHTTPHAPAAGVTRTGLSFFNETMM